MGKLDPYMLKRNGVRKVTVMDYRNGKFVTGYGITGAVVDSITEEQLAKIVRDDAFHIYYDKNQNKLVVALHQLDFDYYDKKGVFHKFSVEDGEVWELVD